MAVPYNPLAPPGTLTVPGSTPDYNALIQSDPGYIAAKSTHDLTVGQAGASRRAAMQALALNYGGLPPGYQDPYGDLSPDILGQAANNPQSTIHRLQANYGQAQQQMQQGLAARGALHSGDLVYGQSNLDAGMASNQYDAGDAFGTSALGYGTDYTGAVGGADTILNQAISTAGTTEAGLHPATADQSATLMPDWQNQYGRPMYTAPDGNLYTPDPATGALQLYATADPTDPTGWSYSGY